MRPKGIGAPLELVFYARVSGDRMPLTDRWVDRDRIGRRTRRGPRPRPAAASARRFGVCMLARPY